jgi:hypothetical protein
MGICLKKHVISSPFKQFIRSKQFFWSVFHKLFVLIDIKFVSNKLVVSKKFHFDSFLGF